MLVYYLEKGESTLIRMVVVQLESGAVGFVHKSKDIYPKKDNEWRSMNENTLIQN